MHTPVLPDDALSTLVELVDLAFVARLLGRSSLCVAEWINAPWRMPAEDAERVRRALAFLS